MWFKEPEDGSGPISSHIAALPERAPLFLSVISLGEIEYGYAVQHNRSPEIEVSYRRFVREHLPAILQIGHHTVGPYGCIRGALFDKYAPNELRTRPKRPEQLIDPLTAQPLGIDENDLWIAAQAVEFNLCLVTGDAMANIREAIKQVYPDLSIVNWAQADPAPGDQ